MAVTSSTHFDFPPHSWTDEYHVVLGNASRFDRLVRKDDFLDEGVAAVFGVAGEQAELLSLSFQAGKFTPDQVAAWLAERRFTPPRSMDPTERGLLPCDQMRKPPVY